MSAPEITEELKNDLKLLKLRNVLDDKTFMKRSDRRGNAPHFAVGTIMDSAEVSSMHLMLLRWINKS